MRYPTLVLLFLIGLELPSLAYDIPPTPGIKPAAEPSTMLKTGTIVGGGLLATAAIAGGLWLSLKRKPSKTN